MPNQPAKCPDFTIEIGTDGLHYAQFRDEEDASYAEEHFFPGCRQVCFGGYMNGIRLEEKSHAKV